MQDTSPLPVFRRGLGRVSLALKSSLSRRWPRPVIAAADELAWRDELLPRPGPRISEHRSLAELGYKQSPHPGIPVSRITGLAHVQGLFSDEAVIELQRICGRLERHADNSDWIISRRSRGVTELSRFIAQMMGSRHFLLAISRIAGVPLVAYPMINARAQINYFYPPHHQHPQQQLGMWHTDGTNYVLNIVLSAASDYGGGEFLYHNGTIDSFDPAAAFGPTVKIAALLDPGDAVFIYGSRLFHGVRPVNQGRRMSLVLSFHCPYTREDSNRFWHLASDDGIPATIPNWLHLRRNLLKPPEQQFADWGIAPIRFADLNDKPKPA